MLCLHTRNTPEGAIQVTGLYTVEKAEDCAEGTWEDGADLMYRVAITQATDPPPASAFNMSVADGVEVSGMITSVWVVAWAVRIIRKAL